jgi:hypothetical protein
MERNIEWAKHLWDDWKYRHEMWRQTFYRSLSFAVIVATVPWVKTGFFDQVIPRGRPRVVYGLLPLFLFLVTTLQLALEYTHLMEVERKLEEVRGAFAPPKLGLMKVFRGMRPGVSTLIYIGVGIVLWVLWFRFFLVK